MSRAETSDRLYVVGTFRLNRVSSMRPSLRGELHLRVQGRQGDGDGMHTKVVIVGLVRAVAVPGQRPIDHTHPWLEPDPAVMHHRPRTTTHRFQVADSTVGQQPVSGRHHLRWDRIAKRWNIDTNRHGHAPYRPLTGSQQHAA